LCSPAALKVFAIAGRERSQNEDNYKNYFTHYTFSVIRLFR